MNEIAVVTGASGGIGSAVAKRLADRGMRLVLTGRDEGRLHAIAVQLGSAEVRVLDLAQPDAVDRLAFEFPTPAVLVNAAGETRAAPFEARDEAELEAELTASVLGFTRLCRHLGPRMAAAGGGRILNIGSVAALRPAPGLAVYAASKAYMLSLSRSLNAEWRGIGITVTCAMPGPTRTRFDERTGLTQSSHAMSADEVAAEALAAMDHGRSIAVIGRKNRALYWALGLLPENVTAALARRRFTNRAILETR